MAGLIPARAYKANPVAKAAILPPQPRRKFRFALTPLADVMFQLLLFFMLSSSLTPYSLLTVQSGAGAATEARAGQPEGEQLALVPDAAIWTVGAGTLNVRGQSFDYTALPTLSTALQAAETPQVVLVAGPDAAVQDIATVLAALTSAGIAQIQIVEDPA